MSNDTPKEGVVIDVDPEQEAPVETEASMPADDKPDTPATGNGRALAGLALLVGIGALGLGGTLGWLGYQQTQSIEARLSAASAQGGATVDQAKQLDQRLTQLDEAQEVLRGHVVSQSSGLQRTNEQLDEVQAAFDEQEKLIRSERLLLDDREAELRSMVASLHEKVGRTGKQWLVAETGYLLKLAEYRLRLAHDPATALAALALADERLFMTGDPGWAGVRGQIARDLTALETLSQPDVTGLWSRLGAVLEQIPALKLKEGARGVARSSMPETQLTPEEERDVSSLLSDLWAGLKDSVRIRRHDEPVAALLPPEQEYFLYENLRLRIEQARLALTQGRAEIYRAALGEARQWLGQHFAASDATTQGLDKALAELADAVITVELPDISLSLSAFETRRELLQTLPAPLPPSETPAAVPPAATKPEAPSETPAAEAPAA